MSLELGEEQVKGWLADVEALLIAPEVVKEVDVKITLQTLRSYEKMESSTEKKDVVLRAIRKDGRKVVDVPKYNFEWLNGSDYGLITGNISLLVSPEIKRPVVTPADKMKVGYTGVEYYDVNDEVIIPYIEQHGVFNGRSGQFVHDFGLSENQYVVLGNRLTGRFTKFYIVRGGTLEEINYDSGEIRGVLGERIKPKNDRQRLAMDLLDRRDIPLKLITGVYGAGKSLAPFHS